MFENCETIDVRIDGPVAWLTLNRPEALNACNSTMARELTAFFGAMRHKPDTRIIVIKGAGRGFCAGLDIKELQAGGGISNPVAGMEVQQLYAGIILEMKRCPQPIIALVHGPASGLGMAMVLAADIRYGAPDARMNAAFIRIGLTACDVGVSYLLPKLVGSSLASELMLTGRFLDAERGLAAGLFSEVVPRDELDSKARAIANEMLRTTPMGLRLTKECINANLSAPGLEHAIMMENRQQILAAQTSDFAEAIRSFVTKTEPDYQDR